MMKLQSEKKPGVIRHTFTVSNKGEVKISLIEKGITKALVGISNGKGIAIFNNIETTEDKDKAIKSIKEIKWLKKGEKYSIIEVLKTIKF